MKANKEFEKLDLEGLQKKEKALKTAFKVTIGMVTGMLVVGLYMTIKQGFSVLLFLPVAFTPIVITNYMNLKKIRILIDQRKSGS